MQKPSIACEPLYSVFHWRLCILMIYGHDVVMIQKDFNFKTFINSYCFTTEHAKEIVICRKLCVATEDGVCLGCDAVGGAGACLFRESPQ